MKRLFLRLMFVVPALLFAGVSAVFGAASIRLVAPAAQTLVDQDKVLVIARIDGDGAGLAQMEVIDNGKGIGFLPMKGAAAFTLLRLSEGSHEISLAAPGLKRVSFKVIRGKQAGYRYHYDLPDTKACITCHPGAAKGSWELPGPQKWMSQSMLCAQCHTLRVRGEFVHGPVAAGSCTPCHDPHGSSNPAFLSASGKTICLGCHDQKQSTRHIEGGENADCLGCHDPHSATKRFHLRDAKK